MANSGNIVTNDCGVYGRALRLDWSVQSQSIANNTTTIAWTLKGTGGATNNWVVAGNFKVVIDGVQRYYSATRINLYNGTVVASGTVTLTHDNNGNKSFSASIEGGLYYVAVNCSASGSWSLPTIARYPVIQSAPNFNDTDNPTITFSNVAKLWAVRCKMEVGGDTTFITRDLAKTATSCTFTLTSAERTKLLQACPNSKTLAVRFAVCAMNGSTELSSSWVDRTMTVVNGNPTFTASYQDTNTNTVAITQNNQLIIRNQSNLRVNVNNISAKKNATISSVNCTFNGVTYSGTISGSSCSIDFNQPNVSSNTTATVKVTDSRGFVTSSNLTVQVLDWSLPTAIITAERQNHYYSPTTLTVDANYASLGGKNDITIRYRYEPVTDQYGGNVYNYSSTYETTPHSPPDAINVKLNSDGSLTAYGSYQTATPDLIMVTNDDITSTLEDGETYILSQTSANSEFYISVMAYNTSTNTSEIYDCKTNKSVTFSVDKTAYDKYYAIITIDPSNYTRYQEFSFTEAFSLVKESSGTWSSWETIGDNVPTVVDLDNQYEWELQIRVSDKLGTTTYNYTVPRGMPIIFFDRLLSSVGINCFPQNENSLEVNGTKVERSVMTKTLSADATNLTANTYKVLPLTASATAGTQLIDVANGGIKIGAGVDKVLISAKMAIEGSSTTDRRYLRIVLNNTLSSSGTLAWSSQTVTVNTIETISITPVLVNVEEGDVINLYYYTPKSTDTIKGGFGALTALTVEVVE